jgi:hypothetical protein
MWMADTLGAMGYVGPAAATTTTITAATEDEALNLAVDPMVEGLTCMELGLGVMYPVAVAAIVLGSLLWVVHSCYPEHTEELKNDGVKAHHLKTVKLEDREGKIFFNGEPVTNSDVAMALYLSNQLPKGVYPRGLIKSCLTTSATQARAQEDVMWPKLSTMVFKYDGHNHTLAYKVISYDLSLVERIESAFASEGPWLHMPTILGIKDIEPDQAAKCLCKVLLSRTTLHPDAAYTSANFEPNEDCMDITRHVSDAMCYGGGITIDRKAVDEFVLPQHSPNRQLVVFFSRTLARSLVGTGLGRH